MTNQSVQCCFISYSSQSRIIVSSACSIQNTRGGHLLRVVDVVDQVLHHSRGVSSLHFLAVVGDDGAGRGADNDGALLALQISESASFVLRGMNVEPLDMWVGYLLAVETALVGLDSQELLTADGEATVERVLAGGKGRSEGVDVLLGELHTMCQWDTAPGSPHTVWQTERSYREAGGLCLQAGKVSGQDTGLVELARAHQTATDVVSVYGGNCGGPSVRDGDGHGGQGKQFEGLNVPGIDVACSREKTLESGVGDTDAGRPDAYLARLRSVGP